MTSVTNSDKLLRKELSLLDLTFLSLSAMIGSGWLLASLSVASLAGPSGVFSWTIAGIMVMFIGLAYAELGSSIPKTGGIVRYPFYSHGSYTGFVIAFLYLLSAISTPSIEALATIEYLTSVNPTLSKLLTNSTVVNGTQVTVLTLPGLLLSILLLFIYFVINYYGIKILGKTNSAITVWKLIIPVVTFILLFFAFKSNNFTNYGGIFPQSVASNYVGPVGMLYAIPSAGIIYSYLGFRQPIEYSGEAKNPEKNVWRAIILSIVIAILIYTFLQIAFIGAINWESARITPGNWSALLNSKWANSPFYSELEAEGIAVTGAWGYVLLIDAILSPTGTGLVYTGTSARTLYGLSAEEYFPSIFKKLNSYRIPIWSLVGSLIASIIFLLPFPSWYLLVGFNSSATVLTYIMGGIGLQTLRKTAPDLKRGIKIPWASLVAPVATIVSLLIVYWAGFTTLFYIVSILFIGIPIFWVNYAVKVLGLKKWVGVSLGITQLIVNIALTIFGYYNLVLNNDSPMLYFVLFILMELVPLVVAYLTINDNGKVHLRSGFWLMGLIFTIYIISYLSEFGPLGSSAPIEFPYDIAIISIVGLIFHYLAVLSGFRTKEIEEIIEDQKERRD
ncbi:APC family permease [Saccharolobus solfataricus]|uniref:Amino acid transporter related protein n=2 Tax=Saccharolobus solfataricus TaxID=2287 RepID=Q97X49_SACS2|nr:APC family permease [Saccharolobus solfataricus]AAK42098.1 Amino acid transporter related protein [Saccharolobus solfataricus P2]AZF84932.1 APC family permease [Saccharolobus solfataricus]QPG49152.1 APC family permease [Saccharolobus solfataricus]SAI85578.1 amino acid permease [Saccharolobus solfataricus]